jgi:hypothetical protein
VAVASTVATPGSGAANIFTRQWGNGALTASGDASMSTWPAPSTTTVNGNPGGQPNLIGLKGGSWAWGQQFMQISDRTQIITYGGAAINNDQARNSTNGGRGGR